MRVERIAEQTRDQANRSTKQTQQASGVSAFPDEKLSLAPGVAVSTKGNLANDLLPSWFLCDFRCSR